MPARIQAIDTAARHQLIVGHAVAFLKAHVGEAVSLRDLCRATRVCERTLRNAFQRVLGISPKRYMIRARLDEARETLRRERDMTVTTIATECGFYELGRFAARYKARFGEYPSATLRGHA